MLLVAGCGERPPAGPVRVSVIEPRAPARGRTPGAAERVLDYATGSGLLRLDEAGQLTPGVAVRWAMIDEGPDGIFRIEGDDARTIAQRLRRALARAPRWMGDGVVATVAVTPSVLDLRLRAPRAALPTIVALPELAGLGRIAGPLRIAGRAGEVVRLQSRDEPGGRRANAVDLRGERVGRAVVRFVRGNTDLVLGGTFADLAVARAGGVARSVRIEHATGLFGFAPTMQGGAYADRRMIDALSLALDRDRLAGLLGLTKATTVAGSGYEPPLGQRRPRAAALLAALGGAPAAPLRLALPEGPGATMMFRLVQQDWARIGIATVRARDPRAADLHLVDEIVPADERARAACAAAPGCDLADPAALLAPPFVPVAAPLRWSLVAPALDLFTDNPLAFHPIDRLRTAR